MPRDKTGHCSLFLECFRKENSNCATILQMLQVATDNVSRAGYILGIIPRANLAEDLPVESSSSCKVSWWCHRKNGPIP